MENQSQFWFRETQGRQVWEKNGQEVKKGKRDTIGRGVGGCPPSCPASYVVVL